ncbi:small hydrophobic protein, partial [Streptomyces sp. 7R007]
RPVPALVALVLGAIDTLLAIIWLVGAATPGNGMW